MNGDQLISSVMAGKAEMDDMPPKIKMICSFKAFIMACEILEFETKERRKAELEKIPERLRPHVEQWVWEIWRSRHA